MNFGGLGRLKELVSNSAFAQSAGSWILGPQTTVVAIHAALLTSGQVFYLAGSGFHDAIQNGPYEARILDVNSGSEQNYQQSEDLFCIGLTGLPMVISCWQGALSFMIQMSITVMDGGMD